MVPGEWHPDGSRRLASKQYEELKDAREKGK